MGWAGTGSSADLGRCNDLTDICKIESVVVLNKVQRYWSSPLHKRLLTSSGVPIGCAWRSPWDLRDRYFGVYYHDYPCGVCNAACASCSILRSG